MVTTGQPHGAGRLVPKRRQGVQLAFDLVEPIADGLQQALARRGRRDAAGRAGQQPDLKALLERLDGLVAERDQKLKVWAILLGGGGVLAIFASAEVSGSLGVLGALAGMAAIFGAFVCVKVVEHGNGKNKAL